MSNLKFKSKAHPINLADFIGNRKSRELAYATIVDRQEYDEITTRYTIAHHGSVIGRVKMWEVSVDNAGWDSNTTRNRMNIILRDNNIPYYLARRSGTTVLIRQGKSYDDTKIVGRGVRGADFQMISGEWKLVAIAASVDINVEELTITV